MAAAPLTDSAIRRALGREAVFMAKLRNDASLRSNGKKVIYFYGHKATSRNSTKVPGLYAPLSNFYPWPYELKGARFETSEAGLMHGKATLFTTTAAAALAQGGLPAETAAQLQKQVSTNVGLQKSILAARTPLECKKMGRQVEGFDEVIWGNSCELIMVRALVAKFGAEKERRQLLLGTGDKVLVEAAGRDRKWGIGLGVDKGIAGQKWRGANRLGCCLMAARALLRQEEAKEGSWQDDGMAARAKKEVKSTKRVSPKEKRAAMLAAAERRAAVSGCDEGKIK